MDEYQEMEKFGIVGAKSRILFVKFLIMFSWLEISIVRVHV